jgi:hypothetical protein
VLLERCIIDVVKFVSLYVLWNLGFTLAFFTMQVGGKVVHIVEVSIVNSLLCCELYVLWNLGFMLAFFTMQVGGSSISNFDCFKLHALFVSLYVLWNLDFSSNSTST